MLGATDEETRDNESSSMFECFMGEHSSLAQVARVTRKTSHLEWLKFLLVCNSQKTRGSSCTEFCSDEHKVENENVLKQTKYLEIWKSLSNDIEPIRHRKHFWE